MNSRLLLFCFTFFFVLNACAPESDTAVSPTPHLAIATTLPTATAVPQLIIHNGYLLDVIPQW